MKEIVVASGEVSASGNLLMVLVGLIEEIIPELVPSAKELRDRAVCD